MTTFDKRERAFEEKFAHDEDVRFRVHTYRNRLLGLWAAQKLRLRPAEADAYAAGLAQADVARFHDDDIVRRVAADLFARGLPVTEHEVRAELERLLAAAKQHVAGPDRAAT